MPRIPQLPDFSGTVSGSDELPLYDASSDRTYGATVDALAGYIGGRPTVSEVSTTTHQPALGGAWQYFVCTNAAGCNVTIPQDASTDFPIGQLLAYEQASGAITVGGEGAVVINFRASRGDGTNEIGAVIFLIKTDANAWTMYGDLKPGPE